MQSSHQLFRTSDLLAEIAQSLQATKPLLTFVLVNRAFYSMGIGLLWRNQESLVNLLQILLPPNVSNIVSLISPPAILTSIPLSIQIFLLTHKLLQDYLGQNSRNMHHTCEQSGCSLEARTCLATTTGSSTFFCNMSRTSFPESPHFPWF